MDNTTNINHKSLSIRICTDGLSFCVYSPSADQPYIYKVYKVKPTISFAANLKEALRTEPILQEQYQRVNVLITSSHITAVPSFAFDAADVEEVYRYNFPKDKPQHVSYNILRNSGIALIFGLDKTVYQLLHDDFPRARFYASASTLIEFFGERSLTGSNKKMFVYLHEGEMTLFAFDQGRMLFINTFTVRSIADCQYYILNVWKQLGYSQLDDALLLIGDNELAPELAEKIKYFLANVDLLDRKDDFRDKVTQGNAAIPYDLQTLLVCGF